MKNHRSQKRATTSIIVFAMRELARTIESGDGVANVAIAEALREVSELEARLQ